MAGKKKDDDRDPKTGSASEKGSKGSPKRVSKGSSGKTSKKSPGRAKPTKALKKASKEASSKALMGASSKDSEKSLVKASERTPEPAVGEPAPLELPIVGIGASAGGLEAFEQFFTHMPPDSGMAFVLVQHLDPTHKSILTGLVRRYTSMDVVEVEDGMKVQRDTVFLIPPNRYMAILHGRLHLLEPTKLPGLRSPKPGCETHH